MKYNEQYWSGRYESGYTQWDAGAITTPLKSYFDQLVNKDLKILIPGCGMAYEAEYLWKQGFRNVYLSELSKIPLENFVKRVPEFPTEQLLQKDFFDLEMKFDVIVEQTFFCSLHPNEREQYAEKMHELLETEGRLVGVLFNDQLFSDHPPYGGFKEDYDPIFKPYFNYKVFETCYNSIKPRAGRELFINLRPKPL